MLVSYGKIQYVVKYKNTTTDESQLNNKRKLYQYELLSRCIIRTVFDWPSIDFLFSVTGNWRNTYVWSKNNLKCWTHSLKCSVMQIHVQYVYLQIITLLIVPNWVLLTVEIAKNTGLDCWVLLPRMNAMTRLIASGTSVPQEPIMWMWCAYFQLPLDVDVVMVIDIIHHLIYIIFWSTLSSHLLRNH